MPAQVGCHGFTGFVMGGGPHADHVSAGILGQVKNLVGPGDHFAPDLHVGSVIGKPHAYRDRGAVFAVGKEMGGDYFVQPQHECHGLRERPGNEDDEFLPPVSAADVR
jgi:hypothetical protein